MTNNSDLLKQLERTGLTPNEARVYLYLLGRGESVGGTKIALGTGIHRQYIYVVIPRLLELGLLEEIAHGARSRYLALAPTRLTSLAREQVYETEVLAKQLTRLSKAGHEQESEVLFGSRELIEHEYSFEKQAKPGDTQYIIGGNIQAFTDCMGEDYEAITRLDETKKIVTYYLGSEDDKKDTTLTKGREHRFHTRYLKQMPPGLTHTVIRKDRVCFFSFLKPPTVHIIKSTVVAQNYRDFFMMLWEMGEG
jgi:DNA-binding MarR family transcriptional regulator